MATRLCDAESRRALCQNTLAYISSLLLRSLTAIDNDRYPNAGKDAAPKLPQSPQNPAPQEEFIAKLTVNGKTVTLAPPPKHARVKPTLPPGKNPLPPTGKEFAQQIFASLKQNESQLPAHVVNNPIYKAATANLTASNSATSGSAPPNTASPSPAPSPPTSSPP